MADPGKAPVDHCLALKVMRLTRPTLGQTTVVQSSGTDLEKYGQLKLNKFINTITNTYRDMFLNSIITDMNTNTMMSPVLPGGLLVLPQSFGNIYLGETFSSYVCVHNDSTEVSRLMGSASSYTSNPGLWQCSGES